eukprot:m.79185 g.79185  ORF g.79185 m.79185 type:complete len:115 (+) comp36129_c0_seq2:77-421(+)
MKLCCCTWNVAGQSPSGDDVAFDEWLNVDAEEKGDIFSVCLQEVNWLPLPTVSDDAWSKAITDTFSRHRLIRVGLVHLWCECQCKMWSSTVVSRQADRDSVDDFCQTLSFTVHY